MLFATKGFAGIIPTYLTQVDYSSEVDYQNSTAVLVNHNDVMEDTISIANNSATPINIRAITGAKVDGYHKDSNGVKYFSFDNDIRLNFRPVVKGDIIRCSNSNCSDHSYFFDALDENLQRLNINAFTLDPDNGDIIFSIDSPAVISGLAILPSDLIRFNSSGDYSLELRSHLLGTFKNIDAVSYLPNGYILISLSSDGNFNNEFNYFDSEVLEYYPATESWGIAYVPISFASAHNQANITSLMGYENDLIFKSGFD